ncbi:GNAT family N-acetyltransferase [Natrarchaeobius chitinivorans]|uniref:GNAT family N-acetyltransferase n=1 Tax=Natrarchaeobius chitinivorans TaxID=1679083 RepID=A0A3N6P7Y2_NATCH|nr:GNAT family N-acetyltransferase [Natrarchaeobius chitinivorans]
MGTDDVRIREATATDAVGIEDVHAASIRELGSDAYDDRQVEAWLSHVHSERYPVGESGFRVVVADYGGSIVGFGLLEFDPADLDESTAEIGAVYVHPDDAREGVGSAILGDLESAARDRGVEALELTASRNAIAFYERHGYEGHDAASLEMQEGVTLECQRMRKRSTPS